MSQSNIVTRSKSNKTNQFPKETKDERASKFSQATSTVNLILLAQPQKSQDIKFPQPAQAQKSPNQDLQFLKRESNQIQMLKLRN